MNFVERFNMSSPALPLALICAFLPVASSAAPLKLAQSPPAGLHEPCNGHVLFDGGDNERQAELRRAALNSPGLSPLPPSVVSLVSNADRLRSDGLVYVGGFTSSRWSGSLNAHTISAATGEVSALPTWSAHSLLDADTLDVSARSVFTHNGTGGVAFNWHELSKGQQAALRGGDTEAEGMRRLSYLRGSHEAETGKVGGTLRQRDSRLGDIASANIWQARSPIRMGFEHLGHAAFRLAQKERKTMLYVGANDGMLHAFSADDGRERLAYVPLGVYANLRSYTQPDYSHRYFVDGHAFTGDVDVSGSGIEDNKSLPDWRTVMVSGLGGGGRGYFILDVTSPLVATDPSSSFKPSSVLLDRTFAGTGPAPDAASEDMGHIYARPVVSAADGSRSEQIVKLNNGRWAVVMGNGINSDNERPVLLIQYLDGHRELLRIVAHAGTGQSNGLSAPRLLDVNGDGKMDIAYAGDLHGNLWKFNLTHVDAGQWGVSDWTGGTMPCKESTSCTPFYVARDNALPAQRQPITTAPLWMAHPLGGVQILFGTGRHVVEADRDDDRTQTVYAVWDKSTYTLNRDGVLTATVDQHPVTQGRIALVQQSVIDAVSGHASAIETPTRYFNTTRNAVAYSRSDTNAPRGWYIDLPVARERVLSDPQLFEGQKVIVTTAAPPRNTDKKTCSADQAEQSWINVLNMITGQPAKTPVFSTADATMSMVNASRKHLGQGKFVSIHTRAGDLDLLSLTTPLADATCDPAKAVCTRKQTLTTGKGPGMRGDWREMQ